MFNRKIVDPPQANYRVGSSQRDFLKQPPRTLFPPTKSRRRWSLLIFLLAVLGLGSFAGWQYYSINKTSSSSFANGQGFSLNTLAEAKNTQLQGIDSDRVNFMVYGLTADKLRTDTIMLASYYPKEHKLVSLNIPRDLYASYKGYSTKIVSLYAIAKQEKPNDQSYPAQFVSDFIAQEYGISVNYWVVADFAAMKQVVDTVGGITVNNPQGFTDYEFPDEHFRYIRPAPHFNAGTISLDGSQALIFSRSRHSLDGSEGSDFARSKRQQLVLQAILSKLKSQGSFTDVTQINKYLAIFGQNIFTDMTPPELVSLAHQIDTLNLSQDYLKTNWSTSSGFLCSSTSAAGEYVLLYGTPATCGVRAGIDSASPYRKQALDFVQNLLTNGTP